MIGTHAQGELLAQITPSVTTAGALLAALDMRLEITLILATNRNGAATLTSIFHDDDGTTYGNATQILQRSIAANSSEILFQAQHPGSGIPIKRGGTLGAQIANANDVTISVYGVTENIAIRGVR